MMADRELLEMADGEQKVADLHRQIEVLQAEIEDCDSNSSTNQRRMKEISRSWFEIGIINSGVEYKHYSQGLVLVMGKFIVSMSTRKWRQKGRAKWYRYSSLSDFGTRFK